MEKMLARVMNKQSTRTSDDASIDNAFSSDGDLSSWIDVNFSDEDETQYYCEEDGDLCVVKLTADRVDHGFPDLASDSPVHELYRSSCRQYHSVDEVLQGHSFKEDGDLDDGYDDEDDEDGYDGYDLDDELVPRSVSDRFGRQRLRKLGKRAYPKMTKSRKLPHYYNRPGCVYGKHGLGLKHNIIV